MDQELLDSLRPHYTERGYSKHPGKFEGEHIATEYYYQLSLDGDGEIIWSDDNGGGSIAIMETDADERKAFGVDDDCTHYVLEETSTGFVLGQWYTASEAEDARQAEYI